VLDDTSILTAYRLLEWLYNTRPIVFALLTTSRALQTMMLRLSRLSLLMPTSQPLITEYVLTANYADHCQFSQPFPAVVA
jgi:hypothetical protein